MTQHRSLMSLLAAFACLWIPLGQQTFLVEHWMKLGTLMAPFLLFVAFAFGEKETGKDQIDLRLLSLILLVAYILHQFEEHWIDARGQTYAFFGYLNSVILAALGSSKDQVGPLTREAIFVINTSLVWLLGALSVLRAPTHRFPMLCLLAVVVVNAVSHVASAVATGNYNPGLLTSLTVFLPLGFTIYIWLLKARLVTVRMVFAGLLWAVLAHVIMIAGMIAANWLHLFPEPVYFFVLIGWSIMPIFIYRKRTFA